MNIGVFFGSRNPEHDVSIITGCLAIQGLKDLGHTIVPVYIAKNGKWFVGEELGNVEFYKVTDLDSKLKSFGGFSIDMEVSQGKMVLNKKGLLSKKEYVIDLAFPAIHGQNGEDGTLQGMFEIMNMPYVGCDVPASAIAMDKVLTKLIYQRFSIPTTKFVYFSTEEWINKKNDLVENIKNNLVWPVFIKPTRLGSSIGMAKASTEQELEFAIEVALHYDSKILVEEAVEDLMDITVAVMGNGKPEASLIQESAYSKDFFSYEDKYLNEGGAQLGNAEKSIIIPARLDDNTTKEIQGMAIEIYKLTGCSGLARVDFLYSKTFKKYYANEINTLPGTLYHHLWKKSGIELPELLTKLVEFAKEKYDQKQKITYTFESAILSKANSGKMKLKGGN
jgi:D-alanine-D-alanine ligase